MIEIVAGEGGSDSKNFVHELLSVYVCYARRHGLKTELLTSDEGHAILLAQGPKAGWRFRHEPGQHCVQRVPATERRGRKQTSFVTVMALPLPPARQQAQLKEAEIEIKTQCGHGPGGQHQNKTASAVRIVHKPTGLMVFINGRDQHQNKQDALRILTARVTEREHQKITAGYEGLRQSQWTGGGRGEKVRTYNFMEHRAADHRFDKRTSDMKALLKGHLELLFPEETLSQ